jgi:hypothetical protein
MNLKGKMMKARHTISCADLDGFEVSQVVAGDSTTGKRLYLRVSPLLQSAGYVFVQGDARKSFELNELDDAMEFYNSRD